MLVFVDLDERVPAFFASDWRSSEQMTRCGGVPRHAPLGPAQLTGLPQGPRCSDVHAEPEPAVWHADDATRDPDVQQHRAIAGHELVHAGLDRVQRTNLPTAAAERPRDGA